MFNGLYAPVVAISVLTRRVCLSITNCEWAQRVFSCDWRLVFAIQTTQVEGAAFVSHESDYFDRLRSKCFANHVHHVFLFALGGLAS